MNQASKSNQIKANRIQSKQARRAAPAIRFTAPHAHSTSERASTCTQTCAMHAIFINGLESILLSTLDPVSSFLPFVFPPFPCPRRRLVWSDGCDSRGAGSRRFACAGVSHASRSSTCMSGFRQNFLFLWVGAVESLDQGCRAASRCMRYLVSGLRVDMRKRVGVMLCAWVDGVCFFRLWSGFVGE